MTDLFEDKARDWDARPIPAIISQAVGDALVSTVTLSPSLRVMDFGAGTGLICSRLAPHVERIYAVDVSPAMLEKLASKPELAGKVEPICRDILTSPLGHPVDLVVSAMAMHHVEDLARLTQAFAEHLPPGGRVALADLDTEDGSFHPADTEGVFHHGIDRDALRGCLEASGFVDVHFVTAAEIEKDERVYPIFLVTATKA